MVEEITQRKLKLYMAHPFDSREKVRKWEVKFEKKHPKVELVNPFYDEEDGNREDVQEIDRGRADRYEKLDPEKVVVRDLETIHGCDGLVAIVDGALSYGTIMEIVHAFLMGKVVYIVATNGHIKHPWLQFHGRRLFESYKDFEHFIEEKLG